MNLQCVLTKAVCWHVRELQQVPRDDQELVALILGMQRGQLLSVLMILTGIILLVFVMRKKVEKP